MKLIVDRASEIELPQGVTVLQLLHDKYPEKAGKAVAARINGRLVDLNAPLEEGELEVVTWGHEDAAEVYRHTASHVMAQAVMELYPGTKLAIGPAISDGFYYDFDITASLSPDDLSRIEERMAEITARDLSVEREVWERDEALHFFRDQGQEYKVEMLEEMEEDMVTIYRQGDFVDLCRGPHLPSTGRLRNFRLLSLAGAYWR